MSGARRAAAQEDAQAPDTEFRPNLVNTVCFLVQFIVMLVTFAVNYQARRACGSLSASFVPPETGGICTLQNLPAASGWQSVGPALFCRRLALRMAAHDALCGGAERGQGRACAAVQAGAEVPLYLGFSKDASERGGRRSLLGHAGTAAHVPGVQGGLTGVRQRAQGHPFNAALRENRAMVRTLQYGGIGFALLVLDLVPGMNGAMSLVSARPGVDCIPAHATAHAAFPA